MFSFMVWKLKVLIQAGTKGQFCFPLYEDMLSSGQWETLHPVLYFVKLMHIYSLSVLTSEDIAVLR